MIASKQDSTVSTPYRSNSSPSRRAPIRQAEHSASRSAARHSGIRELRVMMLSAARLGTPASQSRIGGTIRPSSKTLVALDGIEPGYGAADVVVVAERLDERDHLCPR